jgi:succinate dehydrogenase / fumarate reductase cytochrome b subunit
MRFLGSDLHADPTLSFGKVQHEVFLTPLFLFYVIGLITASWHFAYGIWLFCVKWGVVTGDGAQKRLLAICLAFFFVMTGVGLASLTSFRSHAQQPYRQGTIDDRNITQVR